ncbi:MAG: hypothetical protein N3A54_06240 [Patescibacteria group bacterium]|nr:hypothetical protein [Patescibacteria group bacterium]
MTSIVHAILVYNPSYLQTNNPSATRNPRDLEAVSAVLFGSIQAAVVELFISDNYAPRDLFGNTTIQ